MKRNDAITIFADGITVTTGAVTARTTVPNAGNGSRPYYVRISATAESYVMLGQSLVNATANALLVQPADSVLVCVGGNTHIAYIQGAVSGKVNIQPLEDQ